MRSLICLALILILGGSLVFFHTIIGEKDRALYSQLVKQTKDLRSSQALERHPSHQVRETVEKDVWKVKEGERSHFHMSSDHSTLSVKQHKDDMQISEKLENIQCWDETPDTWLHAVTGSYEIPSLQMHAEQIDCMHNLGALKAGSAIVESLEGQILYLHDHVVFAPSSLDSPVEISSCDAVCNWESSRIEFLRDVEIQLQEVEEKVVAKGDSAMYEAGILTLYPKEGDERCHVWREMDRMDAKEIVFDLIKQEMHCTDTIGQMQSIQNKESFIVADKVVYLCSSQVLILTAAPSSKVLFWQDGCSLSAPEIEIRKDPVTGEKVVHGKGDVRFTFTIEEQNMIDRLISQYL